MELQTSMQSILVTRNIFRIGLLRLSAGTYKATTVSSAAAVVSHLERF